MLGDLWLWIKAQLCFHDYKRVHGINGYTFYQCSKCGRTRKLINPPFFLDYKKNDN